MRFTVVCTIIPLTFGCAEKPSDLPTAARAYIQQSGGTRNDKLVAVSGVLVVAERVNVCERSQWTLGEGSTTGIDSHAVTSGSDGTFNLPPKSYTNVCSYVVIVPTAFAPGMTSQSARVLLSGDGRDRYTQLNQNDVALVPGREGRDRIVELSRDIGFATGSYATTKDVRNAVFGASAKEICDLARSYPKQAAPLREELESVIPDACAAA
jgi:hypothetical protein